MSVGLPGAWRRQRRWYGAVGRRPDREWQPDKERNPDQEHSRSYEQLRWRRRTHVPSAAAESCFAGSSFTPGAVRRTGASACIAPAYHEVPALERG
jgi:hypothetical protein